MSEKLISRFIKDSENVTDPKVRQQYGYFSSIVGVCCNSALFAIKFILGTLSGSIAITADAFNNLSDVGSCIVTMLGFKMASKPADRDHPFGHGRVEYLSGLVIAVLIILVGVQFIQNAVERILHPSSVEYSTAILAGLILSIVVKFGMNRFNLHLSKKINSASLAASAADSISDVMATTVTLISVIAGQFTTLPVDGIMGLVVSVMILKAGYDVARDTLTPLLGAKPDPELVQQIKQTILQYNGIIGVHDLIVHDYGPGRIFVTAHAEVPLSNDILYSHDVIDNAEREISKQFNLNIVLHMDPIQTNCAETNRIRMAVLQKVKEIDHRFSIHDFRLVTGVTHSNVIFDVVVPVDFPWDDSDIETEVVAKISELDPNYYGVITIDRDYT